MAKIAKKKIAIVHIAAKELGLLDDETVYRAQLFEAAGVRSAAELDEDGFRRVMARFESLGWVHPSKRKPGGRGEPAQAQAEAFCAEMARKAAARKAQDRLSPAQEEYIRLLEEEMGWAEKPRRLRGLIKRVAGTEEVSWLTPEAASKVIEGLKAMKKGGRGDG